MLLMVPDLCLAILALSLAFVFKEIPISKPNLKEAVHNSSLSYSSFKDNVATVSKGSQLQGAGHRKT